jgi:hypothetical protein
VEKRLFPRTYKSLQFEYHVQLPGSEDSFANRAVMKDISLRGLRFISKATPQLKADDIADFIFKFLPADLNPLIPHEIRAQVKVKRIEQPTEKSPNFGVAVEFLSGPIFVYSD